MEGSRLRERPGMMARAERPMRPLLVEAPALRRLSCDDGAPDEQGSRLSDAPPVTIQ